MHYFVAFLTVQMIYLRVRGVRRGLGTVAGVRYFSSYLHQTGSLQHQWEYACGCEGRDLQTEFQNGQDYDDCFYNGQSKADTFIQNTRQITGLGHKVRV